MKEERKSNFELLRIVSMLFIIIFHFSYKGNFFFPQELTFNKLVIKSFWMLGELGVNLFIIISGYFLINKKFKSKKVISLFFEMWFYNIISIIIVSIFKRPIDLKTALFPITNNIYWFITDYLLVYILSPYLNTFAKSMSKKKYKNFLLTSFILFSIIPTIFGSLMNTSEGLSFYNRFIWMVLMYLFGGYIKLHSLDIISNLKKSFKLSLISSLLIFLSILIINKYKLLFNWIGITEIAYFWTPNSILMVLLSIGIFGIFKNINIKNNKFINAIASTTLGIYLLHDGLITPHIFIFFSKFIPINNVFLFASYIIVISIMIYIVGCIIDLIRQILEKYTLTKILNTNLINNKLTKLDKNINRK